MRHPHQRWVIPSALVLVLVLGSPGGAAGQPPDPAQPVAVPAASSHTVTLVTGDELLVEEFPDGSQGIIVDPGGRSEPVSFDTIAYGGQTYVLPSDAAPLVPDVLDRELFNVTRLLEYGYTDGVPVIVDYHGTAEPPSTLAGMSATATLTSIGAVAGTIEDGAWWHAARDPDTGSLAGVAKVWLDQPVEADLDESVPLIEAPDAWNAGFDGTGMTVAVLDTGLDGSHPDLAGKVVAEENFTGEPDAGDGHGHGTHVAGIAAGTGAASNGQFTGVAPGAELMNGKVLDASGNGTVSGVIAGMEWAATNGADVVNLSLGTREPTDGTDPMAQALNQLTAAHDVLFVTSAGNQGPGARTVGSPGSADAALTVGSVTKTESIAASSSRGPRLGDDAIKPDVTAPGVLITSAEPGGGYQALSGTSMASPHAAGAAAILRQADPGLPAAAAKALLATTGVPHPDLDVYDQGGGRIDVSVAFDAPIVATPAPLDLGFFAWPHDDAEPVDAELTYTNRTGAPIALDLSLEVANGAGDQPTGTMLSVSPESVTVPAGGSAPVTVTVDVSVGEVGRYGGYLVAEHDGAVVTRTPVGFHKEPERFDLTVQGTARDGRPAAHASNFHVINVDNIGTFAETGIDFVNGEATVRVPAGRYAVMGLIYTYRSDFSGGLELFSRTEQAWVSQPEVAVFEDTTVVLDARDAVPVVVKTPGHSSALKTNPHDFQQLVAFREGADGGTFLFNLVTNYTHPIYATPTDPVSLGDFEYTTRQRLSAPRDLTAAVVAPEEVVLDPILMVQSPALVGEIEARLVDVGIGRPADYDGLDVEGAVVLAERGEIPNGEKAVNAANAGAVAVLVRNNLPGPNFDSALAAPLPTIGLSGEDGELLLTLLRSRGEVVVNLSGDPSAPVVFDLVLTERGHIRDDLTYVADPAELAALEIGYHADVPGQLFNVRRIWRQGVQVSVGVEKPFSPLPRTEYLVADDTMYRQEVIAAFPRGTLVGSHEFYQPGERRDATWFKKPFRPGIRGADARQNGTPTVRDGNLLQADIREWVDASGHGNWTVHDPSIDTTAFRLFTDGVLTAQAERAIGTFAMSPDPAEYRLELDVARDADWWLTSVETRTAWTVQSGGGTPQPEPLPVLLVDYDAALDLLNTELPSHGGSTVDLFVDHQPGAAGPAVAGALAWISYDDGDSWLPGQVQDLGGGHFRVRFDGAVFADNGFAGLRVEAWDTGGNRIEQEIIRAWRLPPR